MPVRTFLHEEVPEKSTFRYTCTLIDETGAVVPAASLTTLTLTLYNQDTALTIINSVNGTSILNVDRGTVDASGNVAILLTPADGAMVDATKAIEHHVMLIQWTYAAGAKAGRHEVVIPVCNLNKVV